MGSDDRDERGKLTFSELDRLRREKRSAGERPRGRGAHEQAARERREALKTADSLFSAEKGGAAGAALAKAVRDAHGTPGLSEACRSYVEGMGIPSSVDLLQIFIDSGDVELMVPALEALLGLKERGDLEMTGGLKSQLRLLASDPNDDVAGLSEDLLA